MEPGSLPRVRRNFSIICHDLNVVELRTGVWNPKSFLLTDQSGSDKLSTIVTGLDGTASSETLAARTGVALADVNSVVSHLAGLGALDEGPSSALDAYLDQRTSAGLPGADGTVDMPVLVTGHPGLSEVICGELTDAAAGRVSQATDDPLWKRLCATDVSSIADGLSLAELAEEFLPWQNSFVICADTVINPPRLTLFNRIAQAVGITWIHGALDGPFLYIGPTIVPRRSACYECFESRVAMNLREGGSYQRYKQALINGLVTTGEPSVIRPLQGLLAAYLALETVNYLKCGGNFTIERTLAIFVPTMEIAFHQILPMPACPACAPRPEQDDALLYFDPRAWLDA